MYELNCLGDFCPIPLMKLQNIKNQLENDESVKLITDHSCVLESILHYCDKSGYTVNVVEPMNGIWELEISNRK